LAAEEAAAAAAESAKCRKWIAAPAPARIAAAAEAAFVSAKKAPWELPVIKERLALRVKRDILVLRDFKGKRAPRATPDRLDQADLKETGVKWAFQDSQASTAFTVSKDLPDQEDHAVVTATMEQRVNQDDRVFPEHQVLKVLRVLPVPRVRRARPVVSASKESKANPETAEEMGHREIRAERDQSDQKDTPDHMDHLVHLDIQVCEAKKVTWELDMKEPKEKLEIQDQREKWVRLDNHRDRQAKVRPVLGLPDHPENGGHKDLKE